MKLEQKQTCWSLGRVERASTPARNIFLSKIWGVTHRTKIRRVLHLAGGQRQLQKAMLTGVNSWQEISHLEYILVKAGTIGRWTMCSWSKGGAVLKMHQSRRSRLLSKVHTAPVRLMSVVMLFSKRGEEGTGGGRDSVSWVNGRACFHLVMTC